MSFKTWANVAAIGISATVLTLSSPCTQFCFLNRLNICSSLYSVGIRRASFLTLLLSSFSLALLVRDDTALCWSK